jgi:hypothetical protein
MFKLYRSISPPFGTAVNLEHPPCQAKKSLAFTWIIGIALALTSYGSLSAQSEAMYVYRISVMPRTAEVSVKMLVSTLQMRYDPIDIQIEEQDRVVRFVVTAPIPYGELTSAVAGSDHRILGATCTNNRDGSIQEEGIPPMPRMIHTGDEHADHARYDAAKAEWMERYPEAYSRLIGRPYHHDHAE